MPRAEVHGGRVIDVVISAIADSDVEARLADGRAGVISRSEFTADAPPVIGASIEVAVLSRDDPKHRVVLSRAWAVKLRAWERIQTAMDKGEPLTGPVSRAVKGGLIVDLGVRAFLPASMIDEHPVADVSELIGSDVTVVVTEVNSAADRVVVSRRDYLRRHRRQLERDTFSTLVVGARVEGVVTGLVEYGAHVDLGGVRALLHRSEMSWDRTPRPSDVVKVGDHIETVVVEVNRSKRRVGLSLRQLAPDPLAMVEPGTVTTAVVTRVVEYGVFARLSECDQIGLVHMSELTDLPGYRPDQLVTPGEEIYVKVLAVDVNKRRLSLSVRQALWS